MLIIEQQFYQADNYISPSPFTYGKTMVTRPGSIPTGL